MKDPIVKENKVVFGPCRLSYTHLLSKHAIEGEGEGKYSTNVIIPKSETKTVEAIKAANRGISSKNLPDAENRGYGIYTSKRMLVEGLGGQYLMISGGNFYLKSPGFDSFYSLPVGLRWNGTIIALRIPYNVEEFNYVNYLE